LLVHSLAWRDYLCGLILKHFICVTECEILTSPRKLIS
jgi:hypothetical protein